MKKVSLLLLFVGFSVVTAQNVGINTVTPKTTLDVNAAKENGVIKEGQFVGLQAPRVTRAELTAINTSATYSQEQTGALIYVTDIAGGDALNERIKVTEVGYYYFDGVIWQKFLGSNKNNSVYSAKRTNDFGLLDLSLTGDFSAIKINAADTKVGDQNLINADGQYVAPSSGVYRVKYEYTLQGGVDLSLLSNKRLGIYVNNDLKENRLFDAVRVVVPVGPFSLNLAAIPVTSTVIDEYMELAEGDLLTFALQEDLNLSVLDGATVSINIHKISD